jgi:hypothetical protein
MSETGTESACHDRRKLRHGESGSERRVVVLPSSGYPGDQSPVDQANMLWPFLQVLVAADDADLESWATKDFGTDCEGRPKGVVEVTL